MELEQQKINKNKENYFGQPINAFSIIKRLVVDWKYYDELLSMTSEYNGKNYPTNLMFFNNFLSISI